VLRANEKAALAQAASSFRENSSNGRVNSRQNFLGKSYGGGKRGVKEFLDNKPIENQQLTKFTGIHLYPS
jgi:hypothetical protein